MNAMHRMRLENQNKLNFQNMQQKLQALQLMLLTFAEFAVSIASFIKQKQLHTYAQFILYTSHACITNPIATYTVDCIKFQHQQRCKTIDLIN
jgi:hypothetical protein